MNPSIAHDVPVINDEQIEAELTLLEQYDAKDDESREWPVCLKFKCDRSTGMSGRCRLDRSLELPTFIPDIGDTKNGSTWNTADGLPPCCVQLLRDLLVEVAQILKPGSWFLHYGTLLGWARHVDLGLPKGQTRDEESTIHPKIIAWTADADVAVEADAWRHLLADRALMKQLLRRGIVPFRDARMGRFCLGKHYKDGALERWPLASETFRALSRFGRSYPDSHPYVDAYLSMPHPTKQGYFYTRDGPCQFLQSDVYPLNFTLFFETRMGLPANVGAVLRSAYGPRWRDPPLKRSGHGSGSHLCMNGF